MIPSQNILILNIGANPLPNYIVGIYSFIKDLKEINPILPLGRQIKKKISSGERSFPIPTLLLLIHSSQTYNFANSIKKKLEKRLKGFLMKSQIKLISIQNNSRDLDFIEKKVKESLKNVDSINSIHLNFTGGTKSMILGSFRGVVSQINSYGSKEVNSLDNLILTDLDPFTFKLHLFRIPLNGNKIFWNDIDQELFPKNGVQDLREVFKKKFAIMDIELLFNLHKWNKQKKRKKRFKCRDKDLYKSLIKLKEKGSQFFSKWLIIRDKIDKKKPNLKSNDFNRVIEISENLHRNKNYSHKFLEIGQYLRKKRDNKDIWKKISTFFTGGWLENFIYEKIKDLLKKEENSRFQEFCKLHIDVEATYRAQKTNLERRTQIDNILIKGYQLMFISLTTSSLLERVKLKTFEVLFRANQLAGMHSKAIIISFLEEEDLNKLKPYFSLYIHENRLSMFGIDYIKNILDEKKSMKNQLINDLTGTGMSSQTDDINSSDIDHMNRETISNNSKNVLILIIGKNPLPNLIAATIINENSINDLPKPQIIFLLHSTTTEKYAHKIEGMLNPEELDIVLISIKDQIRKLNYVKRQLQNYLDKIKQIDSIHLNFTGGTKPMSLGAYLAISASQYNNVILSDIDPNLNKLRFKIRDEAIQKYPVGKKNIKDLRDVVHLSFNQILDLHNFNENEIVKVQGKDNLINSINGAVNTFKHTDILGPFKFQALPINNLLITVIIGYQLYLFYFSKKKTLGNIKKEAFEAQSLSNMLGGDHAKTIIIADIESHKLNKLYGDLSEFRAIQNCVVINSLNLNLLYNNLQTIFTENDINFLWGKLLQ